MRLLNLDGEVLRVDHLVVGVVFITCAHSDNPTVQPQTPASSMVEQQIYILPVAGSSPASGIVALIAQW